MQRPHERHRRRLAVAFACGDNPLTREVHGQGILPGIRAREALTAEITVTDGAETSVHLNYTMPVELKANLLNDVDVVRIKLAQKSALELTQDQQASDIENIEAALIELAEMVANNG